MGQTCQNYGSGVVCEEIQKKKTDNAIKSNKCNQCEFASSQADVLRRHLRAHSEEKPRKCNQCDFSSSKAGNFRRQNTQWRKVEQMQPM